MTDDATENHDATRRDGSRLSEGLGARIRSVTAMAATLAGRCADGRELGQGSRVHAVNGTLRTDYNELHGTALCGAKPGRRSVGWTVAPPATEVNCPRCCARWRGW